MSGDRPLLSVEGLAAGYGKIPILHDLSFTVAKGETVGILGHNGMGKSTLLKTLMGYIRPTAGRVAFDGVDLAPLKPHERNRLGLGYVPQGRGIFPNLTVADNLRMGLTREETGTLDRIVKEFPRLERLLDRRGGALSGGEQQLLALARCLIGEPKLALLDEPTEGIQPSIIKDIAKALNEIRKLREITIVVSEQVLSFAMDVADRLFVIEGGRLVHETLREQTDVNRIKSYLSV